MLNNQFVWDKESDQWENYNAFYLTFVLPRSTNIRIGYGYSTEIFLGEKFSTSGLNIHGGSQFTKQLYFMFYYNYGNKIRYVFNPYQGRGHDATVSIAYQPSDKFHSSLSYTYSDFYRDSDDIKKFDYGIVRFRNTYQVNRYLFFRAIVEYNSFYEELMTDFLASFTYIPGTVVHIGYGSLYNTTKWEDDHYVDSDRFLEIKRGLFFKASYLWRL